MLRKYAGSQTSDRTSLAELDMLTFTIDALRPTVCCLLFLVVSCIFQLANGSYSSTSASAIFVKLSFESMC